MVLGSARPRDAKGNVARTARHIEMFERAAPGRVHFPDENILPNAVQPAGHQIVHNVVALSDLMEHVVDQILLVVERHFGIAEMGSGLTAIVCV